MFSKIWYFIAVCDVLFSFSGICNCIVYNLPFWIKFNIRIYLLAAALVKNKEQILCQEITFEKHFFPSHKSKCTYIFYKMFLFPGPAESSVFM